MSENPVVFFDISIGGMPKGRIEMELRKDIVVRMLIRCSTLFVLAFPLTFNLLTCVLCAYVLSVAKDRRGKNMILGFEQKIKATTTTIRSKIVLTKLAVIAELSVPMHRGKRDRPFRKASAFQGVTVS